MKLLLLAGEESGMIYREQIAARVREMRPDVEIRGYGDYGFKTGDLAVMGIIQVLRRLFYFLRVKRTMERAIDEWRPDVVCTVDYPGLNLKLDAYAKARGIWTVHVVCPQVWAWHQSRIPKIERSVDRICCFLPFEPRIFRPGLAEFVGHPLALEMEREARSEKPEAPSPGTDPGKLLAVLPGSRMGEIRHHMPKLLKVIAGLRRDMPGLRVVIPAANEKAKRAIGAYGVDAVEVRLGGARALLREADAAVVASGTATLEAALAGCPTVLVYHVDLLFEVICRFTLKGVKHIGLINIVCEKTGETVPCPMPELIQQDFTVANVLKYLRPWLTDVAANSEARVKLAAASALLRPEGDPISKIAGIVLADAKRPALVVNGVRAEVASTFWQRFMGLMGRSPLPPGEGLLIPRCSSIHTCFMRFAIDATFLDGDDNVVKVVRNIRPWRLCVWGGRRAAKVLETTAVCRGAHG